MHYVWREIGNLVEIRECRSIGHAWRVKKVCWSTHWHFPNDCWASPRNRVLLAFYHYSVHMRIGTLGIALFSTTLSIKHQRVHCYVLRNLLLQKFASFNASAPSGQSSSALRFSLFLIPDSGTFAACLNALAPAVKCLRIILKRRNLYSNLIIVQISLAWQHSLSYLSSPVQRCPLETRMNFFDIFQSSILTLRTRYSFCFGQEKHQVHFSSQHLSEDFFNLVFDKETVTVLQG